MKFFRLCVFVWLLALVYAEAEKEQHQVVNNHMPRDSQAHVDPKTTARSLPLAINDSNDSQLTQSSQRQHNQLDGTPPPQLKPNRNADNTLNDQRQQTNNIDNNNDKNNAYSAEHADDTLARHNNNNNKGNAHNSNEATENEFHNVYNGNENENDAALTPNDSNVPHQSPSRATNTDNQSRARENGHQSDTHVYLKTSAVAMSTFFISLAVVVGVVLLYQKFTRSDYQALSARRDEDDDPTVAPVAAGAKGEKDDAARLIAP